MVKFCVDKVINNKPYPNLARWNALPYTQEWKQFSTQWPFSEPVHFFEYLNQQNINYQLVECTTADRSTLYPISLSFFDFSIDWFEILPGTIKEKLLTKSITLWFFYSEGDNPQRIKSHLTDQFNKHDIDPRLIQFTSANSSADSIPGFHYFPDDEFLFNLRNTDAPIGFHDRKRSKKFTALVRTHKWWRAATMAKIWQQGFATQGYFSYNNNLQTDEHWRESPITIITFTGLFDTTNEFLRLCPFKADALDQQQHNQYSTTVTQHFDDSYLNVILETHFDADQSDGVFLTEKTFKPIKNCQPFMIFGCRNSIEQLRQLGYKTFDHVIDHTYDTIKDPNERWLACQAEFARLMHSDLHKMYLACEEDLHHNQQLFLSHKPYRLNRLLEQSLKYATIS